MDFNDEDLAEIELQSMISEYQRALKTLWRLGDGQGGYILDQIRQGIGAQTPNETGSYRKKKISGTLRIAVYERDKYRCVTCGTHKDLSLDHITPESKGGETSLDNLQTLCRSCNSKKGVS